MDSAAQEPTDPPYVWSRGGSTEIKKVWAITYRPAPGANYQFGKLVLCLIGLSDQTPRIRFPSTKSRIRYLDTATTELKHLTACVITGLVPVSIYADKLEEEYPDLKDVADHLREWERLQMETL